MEKKMKRLLQRLIATTISCLMILTLLPVNLHAGPTELLLSVPSNIPAYENGYVYVDIYVDENPGISMLTFTLNFDISVIKPATVGTTNDVVVISGAILDEIPVQLIPSFGGLIISFDGPLTTTEGRLIRIRFQVTGSVGDTSPVTITGIIAQNVNYGPPDNGSVVIIAPTVIGVTVNPPTATVVQGNTQNFTAVVTGTGNPSQQVLWTVEGATSALTTISAAGVLTVGADETATTLTVRATSVADPTVSGTAIVTVVPLTLTLNPESVTINNNNLTATSNVGGTATGNITLTHNLPAGVTIAVSSDNNTITVTGVRPAAGQPAITGTFPVTVYREGIEATLYVHVNLTPLPADGGFVGPGGGGVPIPNRPGQPRPPVVPEGVDDEYFHARFMIGYPDGRFMPGGNITRAETAALVVRTLTTTFGVSVARPGANAANIFSDVDSNAWYFNYVATAYNYGLILGFPDGSFGPNQPITREQFAGILARTAEVVSNGSLAYVDAADISGWAYDYVYTMFVNGWMLGDAAGTFRPLAAITRAEAAATICRILERGTTNARSIEGVLDYVLIFPDAANASAWYYFYVIEATNSHWLKMDGNVEIWTRIDS